MKRRMQQGFTLIELMIVIAIIGILAAIAIPMYQDYTVRTKVSEAVVAASPCKLGVSESWSANNQWASSLNAAGCTNIVSKYVSSVSVGASGVISVAVNGAATGAAGTPTIVLTPTPKDSTGAAVSAGTAAATMDWACTSTGFTKSAHVPASCR